jgi:hypothetical protein
MPLLYGTLLNVPFRSHAIQYSSLKQMQCTVGQKSSYLQSNKNCTIEAQNMLEVKQKQM